MTTERFQAIPANPKVACDACGQHPSASYSFFDRARIKMSKKGKETNWVICEACKEEAQPLDVLPKPSGRLQKGAGVTTQQADTINAIKVKIEAMEDEILGLKKLLGTGFVLDNIRANIHRILPVEP